MNRRENFRVTVEGKKKPEKAVVDLFGCPLSGFASGETVFKLGEFLGFKNRRQENERKFAVLPDMFDNILEYYDIDTRGVGNIFAPKSPHTKTISDICTVDEWGITRKFTGKYWDIVENPLKGKSYEEIEKSPFPDPQTIDVKELESYVARAKYLHENTDYAVCASHPVFGVFEIACWLFGFDDFLLRMALEPETVHMFFERYLKYQIEVSEIYYRALGEYIDYTSSGDDFATQTSTFCSKDMFDELILPYFKERIRVTKQYTKAKFLHHSCGRVFPLIPSLIEAGVDILNPIQPVAEDMSPESLKGAYGDRITFHGGFDTQEMLPNGTPEQIDAAVKELLDRMENGKGYIFATAHNVQDDVPIENINALFSAAKKYSYNK